MSQSNTHAMSIRITEDQQVALREIARVNGTTIAEEIRIAIVAHVGRRRKDPDFQRRLRDVWAEQESVFRRLAV